MIPNVFVSSTIVDLQYLRDAVRDALKDIGLRPVMSEYSEVGFIPDQSAETSCYMTLLQCQIAVVIVGKRYGSTGANSVSVTHNEFRIARERKIPIICLVDAEVLSFKRVFEANPSPAALAFPGLEHPESTFDFITEIAESPHNNAISPFSSVADARETLRAQLAHLYGDLLARHMDPVKAEVRDVLAEVRTLRHALLREDPDQTRRWLKVTRLLLDDRYTPYRQLLDHLPGHFEDNIPKLIDTPSFVEAAQAVSGKPIKLFEAPEGTRVKDYFKFFPEPPAYLNLYQLTQGESIKEIALGVSRSGEIMANSQAIELLDALHRELREAATTPQPLGKEGRAPAAMTANELPNSVRNLTIEEQ